MSKNILVLTGSPRKGGNSDMLAEAFIRGAQSQGHHVVKFEAAFKKFVPCIACNRCWTAGSACVVPDAFAELEPLLAETDTLVFVTPIQWFAMSVSIKLAIDKMYAYARYDHRPLPITKAMLLMCSADGPEAFRGALETYKLMLDYLKWEDAGTLTVPNVWLKGDIQNTDALLRAERLGARIQ